MTRIKWMVPLILILVVLGIFGGALLANGDPMTVLKLPTLVPTIPLPTTLPPSATFTIEPTLSPPTHTPNPPTSTPTFPPTATSTSRPTATFVPTTIPVPTMTPTTMPTNTPIPTPVATPFLIPQPPVDATATLTGALPIPTHVPPVETAPNTINIAVLGSDRRPDWAHWRTDVIQIVSIQPMVPAVTVLSIPRDLYVYHPGLLMSRINTADMYGEMYGYKGGGFGLFQDTVLYNLGITVDHYVRTDFDGLIGIVDALGGLEIPVHCQLYDHWPYPDENGEYPVKTLEPGMYNMDGETSLWYARSRKTSSVFARERRQQQVLQAIWRKSRTIDTLGQFPELWSQFRDMVVTDMEFNDVAMLIGVAARLDEQNVRFRNIGYQQVIPWTTPQGGFVFLPNWEEIEPMLNEALGPVPEGRLWRKLQMVEVWNGTGHTVWDQMAADRLFREGFGVVIGQPDRRDYAQTQLIDYTVSAKGGAVPYLQWMFNIAAENVIAAPNPDGGGVAYRLIIGADYQTCRSP
ncbi:MAG: LCP family protein [Chloroflexi bacterium]|nr:LCP family protein [Chloroflexota bacterium]